MHSFAARKRGIYIPNFGKLSVKISVLGSYTLIVALMGVKFGMEEGTFPLCQISPQSVQRVAKPQNWLLSNRNNRHFALRVMLPVNNNIALLFTPITHT